MLYPPSCDGAIISFGSEHGHAGEYNQHPRSKASVPNESVDHKRDSSSDEVCAPSIPQTSSRKSAVLGRDGGFSFADLQHPSQSQSNIFRAGISKEPECDRAQTANPPAMTPGTPLARFGSKGCPPHTAY